MTLLETLKILKEKGVTRLVGMGDERDINKYIANAECQLEKAQCTLAAGVGDLKSARCYIEEIDDYSIIETEGYHIIVFTGNGGVPLYSDYENLEQMVEAFDTCF